MKKILVANRGEIAMRIMKTAREMGIRTVAIYSEADRRAPHVLYADEAVYIGPSPSAESYLNMDRVILAAQQTGADAIHPGYGFLSENAEFADLVQQSGIIFIGPGAKSIRTMGSKLAAKEAVKKYDIPLVPGTDEAITDITKAQEIAVKLGFPVLVKASAGGGGKGMRIINNTVEFEAQMKRAVSEAESAFGDGSVFIEKYIASPRHIEIQILADNHGQIFHLLERECSIQRRHQKVIEEAPSTAISDTLRQSMGKSATDVARACNYIGAGTVEFLLDESGKYYFLEMNTRLQVEHPVTELITGIDLVEQQIRVARGERLDIIQENIKVKGHAIELRIYAEDPANDFLPDVGILKKYRPPSGPGIRVDDGYSEGMEIPIYYDPMLAKLICHGNTRGEAIATMKHAIDHYVVEGVATTLPFGRFVMEDTDFIHGSYDTHFIEKHFKPELLNKTDLDQEQLVGLLALHFYLKHKEKVHIQENGYSRWTNRKLTD